MSDLSTDNDRIPNLYNIVDNIVNNIVNERGKNVKQTKFKQLSEVWKKMIVDTRLARNDNAFVGNSRDIETGRRYWIFKISQEDNKIVVVDPRDLYIVGVSQIFQGDHWEVDIFDGNNAVGYNRAREWRVNWDSFLTSMGRITGNFGRNDVQTHVIRLSFLISEAARFQIVQAGLASLDNDILRCQTEFRNGPNKVYGIGQEDRNHQLQEYMNYLHPILNNYDNMRAFGNQNGFVRVGDIRRYALRPESAGYKDRFYQELHNLGILQENNRET